jgi:hypothetical protein
LKFTTLKVFDNYIEAHIYRSKLESEGIRAFLIDENMVSLDPLYSVAVDGIKLKVIDLEFEKANELIIRMDSQKTVDEFGESLTCPKCQSTELIPNFKSMKGFKGIISTIVSLLFFVYPVYFKNVYKCKACDKEFSVP